MPLSFGRWIAQVCLDVRLVPRAERLPFARGGLPVSFAFHWDDLDLMLQREPDILVVSSGRLLESDPPRDLASLQAYMAKGAGVVIRRAERQSPTIAELCRVVSALVGAHTTVQIFATAEGTHGFGWHYDAEDVFILQTEGRKEYLMRQNTVGPLALHPLPKDLRFERETTPVIRCTLEAAQLLHLPRGMWHMAMCLDRSLSVSIGVA